MIDRETLLALERQVREMHNELNRTAMRGSAPLDAEAERDGYRIEYVDGEWTEYRLDGDEDEWVEVGGDSFDESVEFDLVQSSGGVELAGDVADYIPSGEYTASATLNNGVLNISFEATDDSDEQ